MISRLLCALILYICCSIGAYAQQSGGARATGEVIGRWLVYALLVFLLVRFVIKPLFRRKNK